MNTDPQKDKNRSQGTGLFLAVSAALFIIGIVWHTFVHPSVGATSEYSMRLIQRAPGAWLAMHMFLAAVSALFLLGAYVILSAVLHQRALRIGEEYAAARGLANAQVHALAQPLTPFNRKIILTDGDRNTVFVGEIHKMIVVRERGAIVLATDTGIWWARIPASRSTSQEHFTGILPPAS